MELDGVVTASFDAVKEIFGAQVMLGGFPA